MATGIRSLASEVRIKQLRLLSLSDTPARLAENETKLAATHDELARARKAYEPLISSSKERAIYDAFASAWARFEQADTEMRRLMEAGQQPAAIELMTVPETASLCDEARAQLSRGVALNDQGARRDADEAMTEADAATLSNLAQQAIARVTANRKATRATRGTVASYRDASVQYDERTFRLFEGQASLTLVGGRRRILLLARVRGSAVC